MREKDKEKKIHLASKFGAHIEWIHEKNRGQKISRYCPFKSCPECPWTVQIKIAKSNGVSQFSWEYSWSVQIISAVMRCFLIGPNGQSAREKM